MIRHVMADGTKRDNMKGCIVPKEISESILLTIFGKEIKRVRNEAGAINKK